MVQGPDGRIAGYPIDLTSISVAEENIFFNYDDSQAACVNFKLSNKNELTLYFAEQGSCILIPEAQGRRIDSPNSFKSHFNSQIGFVPILGPVEHNENLYEKEAARLALYNYRAARNFRNIWYHYPQRFQEFRSALVQTWPGMDIEPPRIDMTHPKPRLHMFCPEDRIPREIFWAGFGFQVWCQMLTHVIQSSEVAIFLVDEPDIYLHSDLQRQLLGILRNLGPDILMATHSTEIITEAEPDDIVIVNKRRRNAQRIRNPSELGDVFRILGSNLNPVLTQLAKTKKVLFVEGKDFQMVSAFARKLRVPKVSNRSDFAVVPAEGFNPERIRNLKKGMETTLGTEIKAAAMLDRDYRCDSECLYISRQCRDFCDFVVIHDCKEIENFLLIPSALDRAAARRIGDSEKRGGRHSTYVACAHDVLDEFASERKSYVTGQCLAYRKRFERIYTPSIDEASINEAALNDFEQSWKDSSTRLQMIPGKEALSHLNSFLQREYGITITPTSIIDVMTPGEIPHAMTNLIEELARFAA